MRIKRFENIDRTEFLNAMGCIGIGTLIGLIVYELCLIAHFDIFGWNFGLIFAPLAAGYVETYFSNKYLEETTGAISAIILFFVTTFYSFILTNSVLGLNLITVGSIGIILEAAIPTLIDYFLIIFILSTISYALGISKKISQVYENTKRRVHSIITGTPYVKIVDLDKTQVRVKRELVDINNLGVLFLTSTKISGRKVLKYKGIYESRNIIKYDQKAIVKSQSSEELKEYLLEEINYIKNQTFVKLAKQLKENGCNGLLEMNIQYDTVKKEKSDLLIQIAISGTGVLLEEE